MSNCRKVVIKPVIISSENKKLLQRQNLNLNKLLNTRVCTEEVIYQSKQCDFLKGESQEVSIVNRLNLVNKTYRTVAKFTRKGVIEERTSDRVCSLIGQNNYDTVLSALSSIFNEETKVRGILALLKPQTEQNSISTQVDMKRIYPFHPKDNSCQTNESYINLVTPKKRKRLRKSQFSTYVVKDSPRVIKKCVINIDDMVKKEAVSDLKEANPLPNLDHDPEVSNLSAGSCGTLGSFSSIPSIPDLLDRTDKLLDTVERSTEKDNTVQDTKIKIFDGTPIRIPIKPDDCFHLATQDILKHVTREERMKLLKHQAYIDTRMCLQPDDEGYYPLHVAVINDEVGMVRRQCFALRRRGETVDVLVGGMSALHMAIQNNAGSACITGLLRFGADPLLRDPEGRTGLHLAADAEITTLTTVLSYCDQHAKRILQNNKQFWKPEFENKSDADLAKYLYEKTAEMFDDQGYTPLMVAANLARPDHVSALATRAPSKIDATSRSSGETALYRAVATACLHVNNSSNRSIVPENFLKTVEILVENGADPSIENHSSSSVNSLLTEFNIYSLSMAVANRMNAQTHKQLTTAGNMMLYKEDNGKITLKNLNVEKKPEAAADADAKLESAEKELLKTIIKKKDPPPQIIPEPKQIIKKFTIVALRNAKGNVNIKDIKEGFPFEMMSTAQKLVLKNNFKIKQEADKVVIVENVKLDTDNLPKTTAGNTVKNKNIVITNPAERIVTVNNRRKLKLAPKVVLSDIEKIIAKKRKLNEQ